MFSILVVILLITVFYHYVIKPLTFWSNKGVKQDGLVDALIWNYSGFFSRYALVDMINMLYQKFPGHRYYGFYQFNRTALVLKDTELIKQMVVKDFEHFIDHRPFVSEEVDPFFGKNLFSLKGAEWRRMRSILSPSFTSSKMKGMFVFMKDNSQKFVNHYLEKEENLVEIEMKDVSSRFCNDVIASTAFGTEVDSFKYPDNEFFEYGKKLTDMRQLSLRLRFFVCMIFPWISKIFNIKLVSDDIGQFFTKLIEDTITIREEKKIIRPDMIHLLMEAQKGNNKAEEHVADAEFASVDEHIEDASNEKITNNEIIAQALIFFFAGFDSVSTFMGFLAYELCINQDMQSRLREEIEETLENSQGQLTYEGLVNMKYMDMVVTECLRKWPTQVAIERVCTKPYDIQPKLPHEKSVHLPTGSVVVIPTYGIHHDPILFPNPSLFDPERFSDENKANIKPYTFQPFGQGPRNCIGSRFALLETKIMFFYLLKYFTIVPTEKTHIPIRMTKNWFSILPPDGFQMGIQRIQE